MHFLEITRAMFNILKRASAKCKSVTTFVALQPLRTISFDFFVMFAIKNLHTCNCGGTTSGCMLFVEEYIPLTEAH